jgi:hypothetical protein
MGASGGHAWHLHPLPLHVLDVEKIKIEEKGDMYRLFTWITKIII